MVFWNLLSDIISNVVGRDLTIMWTKITQPQMTLLEMVLLETCSSLTSLSKYEIEKPNDPNIRPDICHFFSTNVLLGSIFLLIKARKLWQNKFRDETDLVTKQHSCNKLHKFCINGDAFYITHMPYKTYFTSYFCTCHELEHS